MHILLVGTSEDISYVRRLQELLAGHRCSAIMVDHHDLLTTVLLKAEVAGVDAIICSNQSYLVKVLEAQPDYIPPVTRRVPSLDNYAGSLMSVTLPQSKRQIEVLIIDPLKQLVMVPYAKFILARYLSKLTRPQNWMEPVPFSWELVNASNYSRVRDFLSQCTVIGVDSETSRQNLEIDCISYTGWKASTQECRSFLLPLRKSETIEVYQYNLVLARNLNALPVPKVLQNGNYDSAYFARWGCPLHSYLWDTKVLFHCWLAELPKDLGYLGSFCLRKIRYWKDDGKTGNLKDYFEYCCKDSWATLWSLLSMLRETPEWAIRNYVQEFPLIFSCFSCNMEGLAANLTTWEPLEAKAVTAVEKAKKTVQLLVGAPAFNPGSSQQVLRLMHVLGCKDLKSSDKVDLSKFASRHPLNALIADQIRIYRDEAKDVSTYFKQSKLLNGRALYVLDPAGTDTARLASQEHSFWCGWQVQNIPENFRAVFESDPDYCLSSVDYPQSEARCVAYSSGDENLLTTVNSERDYHSLNVERFFGIPYEQVMDEEGNTLNKPIRNLSKRVNHGSNYNMQEQMLLDTMGGKNVEMARKLLGLSPLLTHLQICRLLLDRYNEAYPGVKGGWYTHIKTVVAKSHMLVSALGWTRYCFGDPTRNRRDLNALVAHVPQNLSVGIINRCFHRIWRDVQMPPENVRVSDGRLKFRLKAQIHDEILFQYHKEHPEYAERVRELMVHPIQVTDCKGKTRTMLIPPPPAPLGITNWAKLK